MLNIGRIFCCICQNCYLLKLQHLCNWRSNYGKASLPTRMEVDDAKDPIMHPYCGPKNLKPSLACAPFRDFNNGDFVMVRPHDHFLVPVWMGRTQCDVVKDE